MSFCTDLWKFSLLVDKSHDVNGPDSNQIQNALVIDEINVFPRNPLRTISFLFHFENVLDEELLQMFVDIINAQLFKAVLVKILKAKYVENTDRTFFLIFRFKYRVVYLANYHYEKTTINCLDQRISCFESLFL